MNHGTAQPFPMQYFNQTHATKFLHPLYNQRTPNTCFCTCVHPPAPLCSLHALHALKRAGTPLHARTHPHPLTPTRTRSHLPTPGYTRLHPFPRFFTRLHPRTPSRTRMRPLTPAPLAYTRKHPLLRLTPAHTSIPPHVPLHALTRTHARAHTYTR